MRARLNTRIDADGQTLANRDTIRIEGLAGAGDKRMAVVSRQTGPGEWSRPFFVPAAYLQESAELAYAGNVHVAQGRTVDTGHLVVDSGANRSLVYTGATRGREKNTIHVMTGPPDPAQPSRAEREAYTAAAIRQRAGLRRQGDIAGALGRTAADAGPAQRPAARPVGGRAGPGAAAGRAGTDRPGGDAGRAGLRRQTPGTSWSSRRRSGGSTSYRRSTRWSASGSAPREYERYRQDPERPVLLQALREHEIGGRRIEDSLDAITAEPLTGLRSDRRGAARPGWEKNRPRRGGRPGPGLSGPRRTRPGRVREAARMIDDPAGRARPPAGRAGHRNGPYGRGASAPG